MNQQRKMPGIPEEAKKSSEPYSSLNHQHQQADFQGSSSYHTQNDYASPQQPAAQHYEEPGFIKAIGKIPAGKINKILGITGLALIGTGVILNGLFGLGVFGSDYETGVQVQETTAASVDSGFSEDWSDYMEAEPVSVYINDANHPVVTFRFDKTDPAASIEGGTGQLYYNGTLVNSFVQVPDLGFNTDSAWLSVEGDIHFQPSEASDLDLSDFSLESDNSDAYVSSLENSVYDQDGQNGLTDIDTLKRLFRSQNSYLYRNYEITNEKHDDDQTSISYILTPASHTEEYMSFYSPVQILFKKDGQIVYADVFYPDGQEGSDGLSFTGTYTHNGSIPEYDEVALQGLQ